MSDSPDIIISRKLVSWLLAALASAFVAWAGVVWNTGDRIMQTVNAIYADVREMGVEIRHLRQDVDRHEAQPWHQRAGEEINKMKGNNGQ